MFVEFSSLSEEAKVWVYPSSRKFYPQEIDGLKEKLQGFIGGWKSENADLTASFTLKYNRFIILSAEEG